VGLCGDANEPLIAKNRYFLALYGVLKIAIYCKCEKIVKQLTHIATMTIKIII
jgi:hypothetical protein